MRAENGLRLFVWGLSLAVLAISLDVPIARALSCTPKPSYVYAYCSGGNCGEGFSVVPLFAGELCATRTVVQSLSQEQLNQVRRAIEVHGIERYSGMIGLEADLCLVDSRFNNKDCVYRQKISTASPEATLETWKTTRLTWEKLERKEWIHFLLENWGKRVLLLIVSLALVLHVPPANRPKTRRARQLILAAAFLYALSGVFGPALIAGGDRPWHLLTVGSFFLILGAPLVRRILARRRVSPS